MPIAPEWQTYVAGVWLMSVAGSNYLFPVYSDKLHDELGFSQSETNSIGSAANAGTWFGVVMGLFYDKYGPHKTLVLAGALSFLGYFGMYLTTSGALGLGWVELSVCGFLFGQGSGGLYACALNPSVFNFSPEHRGKVVGALVAFFGLCAGMHTQVFKEFLDEDVTQFLLYLSIVVPSVAALALFLIRELPDAGSAEPDQRRISLAYGACGAIIALVAVCTFLQVDGDNATPTAVLMFALLGMYAFLPLVPGTADSVDKTAATPLLEGGRGDATRSRFALSDEDMTVKQACMTIEFWLLFAAFMMSIGTGVTVLDNVDKLIDSHSAAPAGSGGGDDDGDGDDDPNKNLKTSAVAIFSVANTLGRIAVGLLSDRFAHRLARPGWMFLAVSLMAVANVFSALADDSTIYGATVVLGLAYGASFCVTPTLVSELFGATHFGANWGAMGLSPAIGGEIFSTLVAAKLYEAKEDGNGDCYHDYGCFGVAFGVVNPIACVVGAVCAAELWRRTSATARRRSMSVNSAGGRS